jgi:TRAP-type C4-dicarboxylate transport system substrate-binding protein
MLEPWARKLARDSGGRIAVTIHPSMELGGQAPQLIDQVRDGVVDVAWTLTGYTPGRFPRTEVFELPFLNADPVTMNLALRDFLQKHPEEFAEFKLIAAFVHAGQALHSRRPISTLADFRGLKIRIPSRVSGWAVEAMGGVPIGSPVSAIPELLSRGIVDAAFIPFEVVQSLRVDELVDYHVTLDRAGSDRFNTQVFVLAMNRDSYERLPGDLRSVVDRNSGEDTARWLGELWMANEEPGRIRAAKSGELIRLSPAVVAELRERVEGPVQRRWFDLVAGQGLNGPELLGEARSLIGARRKP